MVATKGYRVPKANHQGEYVTDSIVKARAYAVKMIRENKGGWMWWDIYHMKETKENRYKPYSTVAYRPESGTYVWYHQTAVGDSHNKPTKIYADGRIKR